jgi:Domain of unknown function (DUF4177)
MTANAWEYKFEVNLGEEMIGTAPEAELNHLGSEGWELVTVFVRAEIDVVYYFKRPKRFFAVTNMPEGNYAVG